MGKCNNDTFWGKLFQPVTLMLKNIAHKMIECHFFNILFYYYLYIISYDIISAIELKNLLYSKITWPFV